MKNVKLTIEYDGTNYCGWQKQNNEKTIQRFTNAIYKAQLWTDSQSCERTL